MHAAELWVFCEPYDNCNVLSASTCTAIPSISYVHTCMCKYNEYTNIVPESILVHTLGDALK